MTHCLSPPNLWNDSRIQRRPWPSAWKKISFEPLIRSLVSMQSHLKIHCFDSSTEWMHGFRLVAAFNSCWSQLEVQEAQTQPRCVSCNEQAAAAASWASCQQQLPSSFFLPSSLSLKETACLWIPKKFYSWQNGKLNDGDFRFQICVMQLQRRG